MADDPCNFSVWSQAVFLGISQHTVDYATTVKQSLKSPDGDSVTVADIFGISLCVFVRPWESCLSGNLVFQDFKFRSVGTSSFDRSCGVSRGNFVFAFVCLGPDGFCTVCGDIFFMGMPIRILSVRNPLQLSTRIQKLTSCENPELPAHRQPMRLKISLDLRPEAWTL